MPGRGGPVATAVSTTVSPYCTRQLPAACLANNPVSIQNVPDPICFLNTYFQCFVPTFVRFGVRPSMSSAGSTTAMPRHDRVADRASTQASGEPKEQRGGEKSKAGKHRWPHKADAATATRSHG